MGRLEAEETYYKSKLEFQGRTKGEKLLGLAWNCENDALHFSFAHVADKARGLETRKQNLLSLLASLSDPLGIVSPVTVSIKILFQEICTSKFDWDEVLTGEIKRKWDQWVQDLSDTNKIQISRCLYEMGEQTVTECYLHPSKTRVAPLKELSILPLELNSARILAQLVHTTKNAFVCSVCAP